MEDATTPGAAAPGDLRQDIWGRRALGERLWAVFHESWKYFLVSLAALVLDLSVYWTLVNKFAVYYLAANIVSVLIGLILNYALSVTLVFKHRSLKSRRAEFVFFVLIGVAGLVVNEALVALFVGAFALGTLPGKIAAAGASFIFNFGVRKLLLFSAPR